MRLLEGEETLRNQDFEETLVFLKQENLLLSVSLSFEKRRKPPFVK